MSDVKALLEEMNKVLIGVECASDALDYDGEASKAIRLLERIQALLSTHAVIDRETASRASRVLMAEWVQCTDRLESGIVLQSELTRIEADK